MPQLIAINECYTIQEGGFFIYFIIFTYFILIKKFLLNLFIIIKIRINNFNKNIKLYLNKTKQLNKNYNKLCYNLLSFFIILNNYKNIYKYFYNYYIKKENYNYLTIYKAYNNK